MTTRTVVPVKAKKRNGIKSFHFKLIFATLWMISCSMFLKKTPVQPALPAPFGGAAETRYGSAIFSMSSMIRFFRATTYRLGLVGDHLCGLGRTAARSAAWEGLIRSALV